MLFRRAQRTDSSFVIRRPPYIVRLLVAGYPMLSARPRAICRTRMSKPGLLEISLLGFPHLRLLLLKYGSESR
jgi:hypothetical protein